MRIYERSGITKTFCLDALKKAVVQGNHCFYQLLSTAVCLHATKDCPNLFDQQNSDYKQFPVPDVSSTAYRFSIFIRRQSY